MPFVVRAYVKECYTSAKSKAQNSMKFCPNCGEQALRDAKFCIKCGNDLLSNQDHEGKEQFDSGMDDPYFIVAPFKLAFLSVCTFGLYNIYWMFKQWVVISKRDDLKISPFWRAIFSVIYSYPLFKKLETPAAGFLAIAYIFLSLLAKLPRAWWLLALLSVLPLMAIQSRLNVQSDNYGMGRSFSWKAILVAIIGGAGMMLAVVGSFSS